MSGLGLGLLPQRGKRQIAHKVIGEWRYRVLSQVLFFSAGVYCSAALSNSILKKKKTSMENQNYIIKNIYIFYIYIKIPF